MDEQERYTLDMPANEIRPRIAEKLPVASNWSETFADFTRKLEAASKDPADREDLLSVIGRVMEHSVEDGMDLATRFRLTPNELHAAVMTKPFF